MTLRKNNMQCSSEMKNEMSVWARRQAVLHKWLNTDLHYPCIAHSHIVPHTLSHTAVPPSPLLVSRLQLHNSMASHGDAQPLPRGSLNSCVLLPGHGLAGLAGGGRQVGSAGAVTSESTHECSHQSSPVSPFIFLLGLNRAL